MSLVGDNVLSFMISTSFNIKNLVVLNIDQVVTLEFEELEPSGVGVPHLHVLASTSVLDIERPTSVGLRLNGL